MTAQRPDLDAGLNAVAVEYTREWEIAFSDDGERVRVDPCPECGSPDGFDLIWEVFEERLGIPDADSPGPRVTTAADASHRKIKSVTCVCCGARIVTADGDGIPIDDDGGDR
jgi:hypothetical protein